MGLKRFLNIRLLLPGLAAGLIGAVACSTSEQPAPVIDSTSGDAATAVPEATDAPAMTEEAGGHVTVLVTNLATANLIPSSPKAKTSNSNGCSGSRWSVARAAAS